MSPSRRALYARFQRGPIWRKAGPLLRSFDMELTERCNNICLHCCINKPEHDNVTARKEMTTEHCKDLIRQAVDLGALTVRFTGGEPLIRKDFLDLYLFSRRSGLRVLLFTNARLITPELADLFARTPPLEKIEITVYGLTKGTSESITQDPNAFEEQRRGIELLLNRNVPFIVKGALLPVNRHELSDFLSWAAMIPWMDSLPSFVMFLELRTRRDAPDKNRQISGMRMSPKDGMAILAMKPDLYRKEMGDFCRRCLDQPSDSIFRCNAPSVICIDAYGHIQYCLALRHPATILDSRRHSLDYALREHIPKLRKMRSVNPDYLTRCARCFLRGLCEQCPAKSWSEHGVLDQPVEYWCQIAHEQARYLGLISDTERAWEVGDWKSRLGRLDVGL